jgi:hypothetical protein
MLDTTIDNYDTIVAVTPQQATIQMDWQEDLSE